VSVYSKKFLAFFVKPDESLWPVGRTSGTVTVIGGALGRTSGTVTVIVESPFVNWRLMGLYSVFRFFSFFVFFFLLFSEL
jgi:hypothetical protein